MLLFSASIQIPKNIGTFRASESPYENNTDFSFGNLFTGSVSLLFINYKFIYYLYTIASKKSFYLLFSKGAR